MTPQGTALVRLAPGAAGPTELVRMGAFGGSLTQVATDLATAPTVPGVRPPDLRDPDPYVKRVMYHDNVSRWRRRARRPEQLTDRLPERGAVSDATTRLALEAALSRLTPKQRTVLVLRFYEDLTEVQTAEAIELAPGLEALGVS